MTNGVYWVLVWHALDDGYKVLGVFESEEEAEEARVNGDLIRPKYDHELNVDGPFTLGQAQTV